MKHCRVERKPGFLMQAKELEIEVVKGQVET